MSILKQAESGTPVATLCREHDIRIAYIQPGKPQQNAYIERYNRTIRYSWLSKHLFDTLEEVQDYATSGCGITIMNDHIRQTKESHL